MKRVLIVILCLVSFSSLASAEDISATHVMERSWQNYRQDVDIEYEYMEMLVSYEGGYTVFKELKRWIQYGHGRDDKVLIEFTEPITDKGLKLLVYRQDESDMIYLKLPSLRRSRRVSGQDEGNYFAETDLTYRDASQLVGEDIDRYNYSYLENEGDIITIKATPKNNDLAVYGYRIFYIKEDLNWAVTSIEYYSQNEEMIKKQVNKEIQVEDGRWRSNLILFENFFIERKTKIKVSQRKIDPDIKISFSKRDLRR